MIYIVAEVKPLEELNPDSIETLEPEEGIKLTTGTLVDSDQQVVANVQFNPEIYDQAKAEAWLDANDIVAGSIEEQEVEELAEDENDEEPGEGQITSQPDEKPKEEEMASDEVDGKKKEKLISDEEEEDEESFDLDGVEIMRVGTWNDTTFTRDDLDDMVEAFASTRTELKPYLKLGHDDNQTLLQSDGMPSAGWVTELTRNGDSLIAKVKNIPKKIHELIKNKRYGRFSAEVYFDADIKGQFFRRALKAVALLGADTPAVTSMNDLVGLYKKKESEIKFSQVVNTDEGEKMSKDFSNKLDAIVGENKKLKADLELFKKENQRTKVKAIVDKAIETGKITPVQANLYTALMMDSEVKEFSIKGDDKFENKKLSVFGLVSQIIEMAEPVINFSEVSHNVKPESQNDSDQLDEKIQKYMDEKKVDYKQAYEAVIRESK